MVLESKNELKIMTDFSTLYSESNAMSPLDENSEVTNIRRPQEYITRLESNRADNESPNELMMDLDTDTGVYCGKSNVTDDENEDSFGSGQMSPATSEVVEIRKALKDALGMNKILEQELSDLKDVLAKKNSEFTAVKSPKAMENDFKEERRIFEKEKKAFLAEKSDFLFEKSMLTDEIEMLKNRDMDDDDDDDGLSPEEEESDKKTLLNEIVRIKTTSAMHEEEFQRRLLAAENNVTKFQNEVIAMEMLKLAMENRIENLEDEKEVESQKHEEQVTGLLKAAGLYDRSSFEGPSPARKTILSDTWVDLFRRQLDDERMKINALKACLLPYTNCLSREDNDTLHQAGIILIPRPPPPLKSNRNSVSLFRSFSGAIRPLRI